MKMKTILMAMLMLFVSMANAAPGFLRAVFTGSAYDGTSVVSLENGATIVAEPVELYTNSCPQKTTYAFVTYMLMEPGETYYFKGSYDDYATLKIDDEWVLSQGSQCTEVNGSYQVSGSLKWHKLDLRVANNGNVGGVVDSRYCGIVFKKGDAGDWTKFTLADGLDFRTNDASRKVFWGHYTLTDDDLVGSLSFSQSDADNELLFSSSADGTNWAESVVCTLGVSDDVYDFNVAVEPGKPFVRFGTRCGEVENWSATLNLEKMKDPVLGEVSHNIVFGEDDVTFTIPVLALGSGTKKAKIYVRYGLVGTDDFKKTQVATVTSPGTISRTLEGLEPEKEYQYTVVAQTANGGYTQTASQNFVIERCWTYFVQSDGTIWLHSVSPSTGELVFPSSVDGYKVSGVNDWGMRGLKASKVVLCEGITYIGPETFGSSSFTTIVMPSTLKISNGDYTYYSACNRIEYRGPVPEGRHDLSAGFYSREHAATWLDIIDISTFKGYWQTNLQNVVIVSTAMRKSDPTVMEIVYRVESEKPTVKVRVLAFEDGERSFAKVVRPTAFIDGTETAIGDSVAANVEHRLSWRVSADWKIDVAKVKFEVLAVEDDILPLELTTLPQIGEHPSIEYSWNVMEESRVLDALFWLYADGREGLTITDGVLKNGNTKLADGTKLNGYDTIAYVYSGMGYRVLAGEELEHVKNISRLKLAPSGFRQYAVKTLE